MPVTSSCKYHPKEPANWTCANCKVNFCINCVPENNNDVFPRCTLCRRSLTSLSIAEQIPPFWNKMAFFFSSPLSRSSLIVIFIYSLVVSWLPEGKIGLVIHLLLLFPLTEYLFELMEKIANGEKLTSKVKLLLWSENKGMFVKMLFTYGFISVLIVKTTSIFGAAIGYPIAAFFLLGTPASFIILMMEKTIFSMINPVKIGYIIRLFGGAYFLLYLVAIFGVIVSSQFSQAAVANSNNMLAGFTAHAFSAYLVIVLFSMLGYLVFQHHHELNYSVRSSNLQSLRQPLTNQMIEIEIFLQEGRFEDAQKLLLNKINDNPMDHKANEKLILLYGVQGNYNHMEKIADAYFAQLVKNGKQSHAAEFYFKLSDKGLEYFPESALLAISIAQRMNNSRQYQAAIALLDHYSCMPGGDQTWDKVALVKASLLVEFGNDNITAISLLDNIIKRSVEQDLLTEAEKYRAIIRAC